MSELLEQPANFQDWVDPNQILTIVLCTTLDLFELLFFVVTYLETKKNEVQDRLSGDGAVLTKVSVESAKALWNSGYRK